MKIDSMVGMTLVLSLLVASVLSITKMVPLSIHRLPSPNPQHCLSSEMRNRSFVGQVDGLTEAPAYTAIWASSEDGVFHTDSLNDGYFSVCV